VFINNTNDCSISSGNRIGSSAHKQLSRSTVRRNWRQQQSSDSEDSCLSDSDNSDKGVSSECFYLNVCILFGVT
jgi:hypothetical protein